MTTAVDRAGAIRLLAQRDLCRQSFPDFLTYCKIRSDDPAHPALTPLTPYGYQVERAEAWQSGAWEAILKERQLGFSAVLVAPFLLWCAMYRGWKCAYTSVDQDAAREEISRIEVLYESLPAHLRVTGKFRADDCSFDSGGGVVAFASTDHAGISYTFQLWVQDEAAFHPYGAQNFAAIMPAVANGQVLVMSTAAPKLGPSGHFHDLYWASKRGETGFTAVFEARRRPDRDAAWYARMRATYIGRPEEFDAYYPETDTDAFVGRSGLVYPMFSEARHVMAAPQPWGECLRRVAGIDFGGGDPTAVVVLGVSERPWVAQQGELLGGKVAIRHVHQYGEFYERGPVTVEMLADYLRKWPGIGAVMCDPSQPVVIATLRAAGFNAIPADNKRGEGLGAVAMLLDKGTLTIDPSCKSSIAEFPGYRWSERTDPNDHTKYATSTPVDHHADAMDARRYAVMDILTLLTTGPTIRTLSGRPLAKAMT